MQGRAWEGRLWGAPPTLCGGTGHRGQENDSATPLIRAQVTPMKAHQREVNMDATPGQLPPVCAHNSGRTEDAKQPAQGHPESLAEVRLQSPVSGPLRCLLLSWHPVRTESLFS